MEFKLGDTDIPFLFRGDELMYPNYVKDGLVLHYDFSGMTNTDTSRGISTDLSGNGNHGTLQNFNYTADSGYDKNKLLFDGVDDFITQENMTNPKDMTISIVLNSSVPSSSFDILSWWTDILLRISNNGRITFIDKRKTPDRFTATNPILFSKLTHILVRVSLEVNEIYFNGDLIGRMSASSSDNMTVNSSLRIGSINSANSQYEGSISDFKIYNRSLTPEEIAHNYAIEKERFGIE